MLRDLGYGVWASDVELAVYLFPIRNLCILSSTNKNTNKCKKKTKELNNIMNKHRIPNNVVACWYLVNQAGSNSGLHLSTPPMDG